MGSISFRLIPPLLLASVLGAAVAFGLKEPVPLSIGHPPSTGPQIVAGLKTFAPRPLSELALTYPEAAVEAPDGSIYVANALGFSIERIVGDTAETVLTGQPEDRRPSIFLDLVRDGEKIYALDGANARIWNIEDGGAAIVFEAPEAPNFVRPDGTSGATEYLLSSLDVDGDVFLVTASRVVWQGGAQQYNVQHNSLFIGGDGVWEEVPGTRAISERWGNFREAVWKPDGTILAHVGGQFVHIGLDGEELASVSLENDSFGGGIVPNDGGWLVGAHTKLTFVSDDFTTVRQMEVGFPTANIGHLAWAANGRLLVTDTDRQSVYLFDPKSAKALAQYGNTGGISFKIAALDVQDDRLLLLDNATPRVMSYDPEDGSIYLVAGDGQQGYESPTGAHEFSLQYPSGLSVAPDGSILVSEANYRLARIDGGWVSIRAGSINSGTPTVGMPFDRTLFGSLRGLDHDAQGRLLVVDQTHHSVWRLELDGTVGKVMGTGTAGQWKSGEAATSQPLNHPTGILVRRDGTILIADSYNHSVVGISPDGTVFPFAGIMKGTTYQGHGGYSGDGGPAVDARMNTPRQMAEDADGNVYILDEFNNAIRKVGPDGTISLFAGGMYGFSADGSHMSLPQAVAVLGDHLYVADTGNSVVWAFPLN